MTASPRRRTLRPALLLFALLLSTPVVVHALVPPTAEELVGYAADGTLAARRAYAESLGNHVPSPEVARSIRNKMEDLAAAVESGDSRLFAPQRPYNWTTGLPTTGSPKILVLCIEFADSVHTNDTAELDSKIFGAGDTASDAPYESLNYFYRRSSYNQLDVRGNVLGWYRTTYPRGDVVTTPTGRENLIKEALTHFDTMGHDFSQYDNNGDGKIDFFAVLWTGPDNGWGNFWWAYKTSWNDAAYSIDGKKIDDYSWQYEARPWPGDYKPRTLIHEMGHGLGLPDYYDYDANPPRGGVGGLDMMDSNWGDHNSFSKFVLDWLTPTVYWSDTRLVTLATLDSGPNAVLAMPDAAEGNNFGEFFMIDNREKGGNDMTHPGKGLLIWHVDSRLDTSGNDYLYNNSTTGHKLLRLCEADGLEEIEVPGTADAGDFYDAGDSLTPTSTPSSNRYDGTATGIRIDSFSAAGSTMSFRLAFNNGDTTPRTWYVNDGATAGDSYTSAVGDDGNSGLAPNLPKRTLGAVFNQIRRGDTVLIDAGTFAESVTIGASHVTVRGVDSASTVIAPGDSTTTTVNAIYAENRTSLRISDLRVTEAYYGVNLKSVDSSAIERVAALRNGLHGIYLQADCSGDTIEGCWSAEQKAGTSAGIYLGYSPRNLVRGNTCESNTYGMRISYSHDVKIEENYTKRNSTYGVYLFYSDRALLTGDSATNEGIAYYISRASGCVLLNCGSGSSSNYGVYLYYSDSNVVRDCHFTGGSSAYGFSLYYSNSNLFEGDSASRGSVGGYILTANNNTFSNITSYMNASYGFWFRNSADTNLMVSCTSVNNGGAGLYVGACTGNVFLANSIANNRNYGVRLDSTISNRFEGNAIDSNSNWQVYVFPTCTGDSFVRNRLAATPYRPESYLFCTAPVGLDFRRNWFGTTDSARIRNRIGGPYASLVTYQPYRLGPVDSGPFADTVAPRAPDTVAAVVAGYPSIRVTWSPVTVNEDGLPGPPGVAGYRIYRSPLRETSAWIQVGSAAAAADSYLDAAVSAGTGYYYRVTAFDAASPQVNESYFSDSIAVDTPSSSPDTSGPNAWYVNDTSTTADSWTTAVGSDANLGLTPSAPKRTLAAVSALLTAGDSVYIDAGRYRESIVIAVDSVALLGADSRTTIVDANFDSYCVRAAGRWSLAFVDLAFVAADHTDADWSNYGGGIALRNCTGVTILRDSFHQDYNGIWLEYGCESVAITGCRFDVASSNGVYAETASWIAVRGNLFYPGGLQLSATDSATLSGNTYLSSFLFLDGCRGCTVSAETMSNTAITIASNARPARGNLVSGCTVNSANIEIQAGSAENTLSGNTVNYTDHCITVGGDSNAVTGNAVSGMSASGYGVRVSGTANVLTGNTASSKRNYGFLVTGPSNTLDSNTATACQDGGFWFATSGDTNLVRFNRAVANPGGSGFSVQRNGNLFIGNTATGNADHGFLLSGARGNIFRQNHADSNQDYGFAVQSSSTGNTFEKNDIVPSPTRPDSGVYYDTTIALDLRRSFWNTTDSLDVRSKIAGAGAAYAIHTPFRLSFIDTALNADTVAPRSPDTVAAVTQSTTVIRVSWSAVVSSEAVEPALGLAGYRIYRASRSDSSSWILAGSAPAGTHVFDDTQRVPGDTVHYRVAAIDNATPWANGSFFSDSAPGARATPIARAVVNALQPATRSVTVNETFAVVAVTVAGDTLRADTLVHLSVSMTGPAASILAAALHLDADRNGSWGAADTFVAYLPAAGGGVYAATLARPLGTSPESFLVALRCRDTAVAGETFQATLPVFSVRTTMTETGPEAAQAAPGVFTVASLGAAAVAVNLDTPRSSSVLRGESVVVLAFALTGDTAASDTFQHARIFLAGGHSAAETVALYRDATGNGLRGGDDTLVTTLLPAGGGYFYRHSFDHPIGTSAARFLVAITIDDTATIGDTLLAGLAAQGLKTAGKDSAPPIDTTSVAVITISIDTSGPNDWFVNDASTANDSFSISAGSDANSGLARHVPKATITAALALASAGDTILVDAGLYAETVVIRVDGITLLGSDSRHAVIDPPGESNVATLFACSAANRVNLRLLNLGFRGAYNGLRFTNVDSSLVSSCSASLCGSAGFNVDAATSAADTFTGNWSEFCVTGFSFSGNTAYVSGNTARRNGRGFTIGGTGSTYAGNRAESSTHGTLGQGFFANGASMTVTGNTACGNQYGGFSLGSGAGNLFTGNHISGNYGLAGIYQSGDGQVLESNTITGNTEGVFINSGDSNVLVNNRITSNSGSGIRMEGGANGNVFRRNLVSGNSSYGVFLNASFNNLFTQNQFETNSQTNLGQVFVSGASNSDTFQRNNFRPVGVNPFGIDHQSNFALDARWNHWYTTDSSEVDTHIHGTNESLVVYIPFRFREVDTSADGDTVAPAAPDTVAAAGETLVPRLSWKASAIDEDGSAQNGLDGYRVYRAASPSAASWTRIAQTAGLSALDTGLTAGQTAYYRVTAYDNNGAFGNEAYLSDSVASFTAVPPSLDTRLYLGALPPGFEADSRQLVPGRWRTAAGDSSALLFADSTLFVRHVRVVEASGYGDTVVVFADSGAGFRRIAESTVVAGRSDFALALRLVPETNAIRVHVGDTGATQAAAAIETGWIFVDLAAPTAPALTAPAVAAETSVTSVFFSWDAAADTGSGVASYRLQIDTAGTFVAPFVDSSTGLGTSASRSLSANETYSWRVIATDNMGNASISSSRTLLVDTAPPVSAALSLPAAGHETRAATILFSWSAGSDTLSGVGSYRLQIDTAGTFTAPLVDSATGLATSASRALNGNETYSWRVITADDAGNTSATAARILVVDTTAPTTPNLRCPLINEETRVVSFNFSWSASTDALSGVAGYRLQVDTVSSFTSMLVDSVTGLAVTAARTLPSNAVFYWRVVCADEAGNTCTTGYRVVTIDTVPPVISLSSPSDSATIFETRPVFSWSKSGCTQATWQVSRNTAFTQIVDSATTSADSRQSVALESGVYYWRVWARDTAGNAETTAYRRLAVDTSPNLHAPSARAALSGRAHLLANETTTLSGASSTDSDGNALAYLWTCTPSSGVVFSDSAAVTTTFRSSETGLYAIVLRVTDGLHTSFAETITIRVVRLAGDFAGGPGGGPDGMVTLPDLEALRPHFGRRAGQAGFDASYDLDGDGVISLEDFFRLGRSYGQ